jgi:Na+/H+ antiporter NhaD/arsenite permease-like protein
LELLLSNLIGTTGASMLLIRRYLRAKPETSKPSALGDFFIFVVSNIGGLLTPLGDPPLFLGFLRRVPFQWTLNLTKNWPPDERYFGGDHEYQNHSRS